MTRSRSDMLHFEEKWWTKEITQLSSTEQLNNSTEQFKDHRSNMVLTLLQHHHSKTRGRFWRTEAVWTQSSQGLLWLYIKICFFFLTYYLLCTKSCPCHRISNFSLPYFISLALFFTYWGAFYVLYCRDCKQLTLNTYFETTILSDIKITSSMTFSLF